jgi:hypothetical protein
MPVAKAPSLCALASKDDADAFDVANHHLLRLFLAVGLRDFGGLQRIFSFDVQRYPSSFNGSQPLVGALLGAS